MKAAFVLMLALAGLTSFAATAAQAEDQHWYAVEVIAFKPTASMAGGDEMWPDDPKLPDVGDAVVPTVADTDTALPAPLTLDAPQTVTVPAVTPLPTADYKLDGVWKRLQSSGRYQTLLHTGWIQQGKPRAQAQPISITPLMTATAPGKPADNVFSDFSDTAAPAPLLPAPQTTAPPIPAPPSGAPVFGTVTLSLDRYLHLAVDLAYRPTGAQTLRTYRSRDDLALPAGATMAQPAATGFGDFAAYPAAPAAIVMDQSRRIQPGNINYFDHPLFGAIIEVTPVPAPAAAAAPQTKR